MANKKVSKTTVSRRGLVVRLLLIALLLYVLLKAVQLYGQLEQKRLALEKIHSQIQTQTVYNEGLMDQVSNSDEYVEHKANEDGYYMPGQQIYQNEAG